MFFYGTIYSYLQTPVVTNFYYKHIFCIGIFLQVINLTV